MQYDEKRVSEPSLNITCLCRSCNVGHDISLLAQRWSIDSSSIKICQNADGTLVQIGHGAYGSVGLVTSASCLLGPLQ